MEKQRFLRSALKPAECYRDVSSDKLARCIVVACGGWLAKQNKSKAAKRHEADLLEIARVLEGDENE